MNRIDLDPSDLSTLSHILAAGLAAMPDRPLDLPLEVALALTEARTQMKGLPEVILNLNLADERFRTVAEALVGMIDLADRAAEAEADDQGRALLHEQFADLAKIVAADAGQSLPRGPRLNLKSRAEALSAAKIIRYLDPVVENMGRELEEQKRLVHEAINETISFLNLVTECYPEAEGNSILNLLVEATRAYHLPLSSPAGRLH